MKTPDQNLQPIKAGESLDMYMPLPEESLEAFKVRLENFISKNCENLDYYDSYAFLERLRKEADAWFEKRIEEIGEIGHQGLTEREQLMFKQKIDFLLEKRHVFNKVQGALVMKLFDKFKA